MKPADAYHILVMTKAFAMRIVRLYQYLISAKQEYVMSKQLLKCGTSIGANAKEAVRGQSRADFGSKMNISLKEASECEYWIELLHDTDYITDAEYKSIQSDCVEIIKVLTSIVKSTFHN